MNKSLTRVVGEGTFWFSFNNIILKFIGLGSTFLILSYFSIHDYGLITLVLSAIPIFSFFILPGLDSVVIADMGIEKSKSNFSGVKSIFNNYFILQITLSVFAWATLFFGSNFIGDYYEHSASLLRIVSFFYLVSPFRIIFNIVMKYGLKFFHQSLLTFFEELFKLIFVIISIFIVDAGIKGILFSMVFSQVVALLLVLPAFLSVYRVINNYEVTNKIPIWDMVIKHGKWSILSTYTSNLSKSARLWIIKYFLGTDVTGLFALALGLYGHTTSLIPISSVITPIIPQYINDKERFSRIISKSIKYQTLGYILIGIVAFITFPYLVVLIVPKYMASLTLFKVMLLALIPASLLTIFNPTFHALRAQKNIFTSTILRLILVLLILPATIIVFGVQGIAVEFVATIVLYTIQRYFSMKKLVPNLNITFKSILSVDQYDYLILNKFKLFVYSYLNFYKKAK